MWGKREGKTWRDGAEGEDFFGFLVLLCFCIDSRLTVFGNAWVSNRCHEQLMCRYGS